jgi:hypothetical protein
MLRPVHGSCCGANQHTRGVLRIGHAVSVVPRHWGVQLEDRRVLHVVCCSVSQRKRVLRQHVHLHVVYCHWPVLRHSQRCKLLRNVQRSHCKQLRL